VRWTEGKIMNLKIVMAIHTLYGLSVLGSRHILNCYLLSRNRFYLLPVVDWECISTALLRTLQPSVMTSL
jgi:hypothetical protein